MILVHGNKEYNDVAMYDKLTTDLYIIYDYYDEN